VQFKPHFIAAGSLFLAAKFHNFILPSKNGRVWWNEFDVAPKQLQDVIQQMTELFRKRDPHSMGPVIKPVATSTPTGKHQIKPTPNLTPPPTNKQQINATPTPMNKQLIKQTPTPTLMDKHQVKPSPLPTPMDKQHIKPTPIPTPMVKQKIKAIPAPTPTDKQQILSTPDPPLKHTQFSRRSFSNSNTEAYGYVPFGSSFDDKSTGRSAMYEENQYPRRYEENMYKRKHINHNLDQRLGEQSYQGILKTARVNEAEIKSFGKKSTSRSARRTCEENPYQQTHINHNSDAVAMDQRLEGQACRGNLKAGCVNEAGIRDLKKRRVQEVTGLQAPVHKSDTNAWRYERQVSYVGTNSSWKKQKIGRRYII
jgi:cyclin T